MVVVVDDSTNVGWLGTGMEKKMFSISEETQKVEDLWRDSFGRNYQTEIEFDFGLLPGKSFHRVRMGNLKLRLESSKLRMLCSYIVITKWPSYQLKFVIVNLLLRMSTLKVERNLE